MTGLAAVWMMWAPRPAWGQWITGSGGTIYYNGGKVGIGTASPGANLTLYQASSGAASSLGFAFTGNSIGGTSAGSGFLFSLGYNNTGNKQIWFGDPDGAGNASYSFARFGTFGPGSIPVLDAVTGNNAARAKLQLGNFGDTNSGVIVGTSLGVNGYAAIGTGYYTTAPPANGLIVQGNVGIGTTNPLYKLAVNGNIGAKDVTVTISGWSDYVFRPGYRLRPLSEVGAYIEAHHHLPGIPSEAEVKQKGVSVGDMQAKLLAKIEELTLHMIRQEKQNQELRERLAQLESRIGR